MLLQILSCLLVLVLTRVVWRRWKYDLHRIPSPPTIPFFLDTMKVLRSTDKGELSEVRGRWWKALGCPKIMKLNLLGETALWVCDMRAVKSVVLTNRNPLPKPNPIKSAMILFGNDLKAKVFTAVATVDPYVKSARRIYSTAFQSSNLRLALPRLAEVVHRMLDIIETKRKEGPIDFQNLCVQMTLDVIGEVAFGCNLGGLDGSRDILQLLLDVGYISIERRANPITKIMNRFFPHSRRIRQQNEKIDRLTAEWTKIANDIMERQDPPPGEEPMWYGLKNLIDPETGKRVSFVTLRAEVASAVLAGTDTTGHQLAWLLALISDHPEVEDRLLEELKEHDLMGPEGRDVAFDDFSELAYLNAFIKEGMRVAPAVLGTFRRRAPTDMTILGYRIPKGTLLAAVSNRWMNSEEDWGHDPEAFKPERWLTGEDMSEKYYLGFSYGPRDCVGQRLAVTEIRAALITILKRYHLSLTVPYNTLLKNSRNGIAIGVRDGVWFNVTPREEA